MILKFTIQNFRSIRDQLEFSLTAESGKTKSDNTFEINLPNEQNERLLRSAVIYGANASGKSNFIRALFNLVRYVQTSNDFNADQPIIFYEPFLFDKSKESAPTAFTLEFVLPEDKLFIKYRYHVAIDRDEVTQEILDYFPKGQSQNLFTRSSMSREGLASVIHTAKLGRNLGYKEYKIFGNQLFISQFGRNFPHEELTPVYLYLAGIEVWNALDRNRISQLRESIAEELLLEKNEKLLQRLIKLLRVADTKIINLSINEAIDPPKPDPEERKRGVYRAGRKSDQVLAHHDYFIGKEKVGWRALDISEESAGTRVLFALGGVILKKLEEGGVLFFDELDNSLHPKLSKFLVRLFNNPISNPHNAQLVVATHEVTLLDKDVFRKDQIWFAEKSNEGATEIFSAKDFEGVRDDTPFDKWYMNGKFGGQPHIKEIEFIFSNE